MSIDPVLRHRQTEAQRRAKLRNGFERLRDLTGCMPQVQRCDVLQEAIELIEKQQERIEQLEAADLHLNHLELPSNDSTTSSSPTSCISNAESELSIDLSSLLLPMPATSPTAVTMTPSSAQAIPLQQLDMLAMELTLPYNETRLLDDGIARFVIGSEMRFLDVNQAMVNLAQPDPYTSLIGLDPYAAGCKIDMDTVGFGIEEMLQGIRTILVTQERIRPLVDGPPYWVYSIVMAVGDGSVYVGAMQPLPDAPDLKPAILA